MLNRYTKDLLRRVRAEIKTKDLAMEIDDLLSPLQGNVEAALYNLRKALKMAKDCLVMYSIKEAISYLENTGSRSRLFFEALRHDPVLKSDFADPKLHTSEVEGEYKFSLEVDQVFTYQCPQANLDELRQLVTICDQHGVTCLLDFDSDELHFII